tara:strand:+ start:206 stop:898 length:693 start_codon:yes stop_codon:yes gene_type:complete
MDEGLAFCPSCGERIMAPGGGSARGGKNARASDHLFWSFNMAMANPMVFLPVIIGGLISSTMQFWESGGLIVSIFGLVVLLILNFMAIDMSRDLYMNEPLDLGSSFSYATGRIGTFFVASIIAGIFYLTIVLTPIAILLMVIIVVDETGIGDALNQTFRVLGKDLRDIIVILLVTIIGYLVLERVPIVGGILAAAFGQILNLAFIDIYDRYRRGDAEGSRVDGTSDFSLS